MNDPVILKSMELQWTLLVTVTFESDSDQVITGTATTTTNPITM